MELAQFFAPRHSEGGLALLPADEKSQGDKISFLRYSCKICKVVFKSETESGWGTVEADVPPKPLDPISVDGHSGE